MAERFLSLEDVLQISHTLWDSSWLFRSGILFPALILFFLQTLDRSRPDLASSGSEILFVPTGWGSLPEISNPLDRRLALWTISRVLSPVWCRELGKYTIILCAACFLNPIISWTSLWFDMEIMLDTTLLIHVWVSTIAVVNTNTSLRPPLMASNL